MTKEIPLTHGKVAIVDDADYEWLMEWYWRYHHDGYAQTSTRVNRKSVTVFMHRLIMNTPKGLHTDHIDGNGLNNTRGNLRVCTNRQNQQNSRKHQGRLRYKGVRQLKTCFIATICVDGQRRYLGSFKSDVDAAKAYDEAARQYFREFARTNF